MITIDMIGEACPIPVIETKKQIAKLGNESATIQVFVDNEAACGNLSKMSVSMGYPCEYEKEAQNRYRVTIQVSAGEKEAQIAASSAQSGLVVAIGKNRMGEGDEELGKILIKGFIYSLIELPEYPKSILFFNSGIHLTCKDASTVDDLFSLKEKGTDIYVCGTCVNFYDAADRLAIGEIVNMYEIVTHMNEAARLITMA